MKINGCRYCFGSGTAFALDIRASMQAGIEIGFD
jgi:hypothetical protein